MRFLLRLPSQLPSFFPRDCCDVNDRKYRILSILNPCLYLRLLLLFLVLRFPCDWFLYPSFDVTSAFSCLVFRLVILCNCFLWRHMRLIVYLCPVRGSFQRNQSRRIHKSIRGWTVLSGRRGVKGTDKGRQKESFLPIDLREGRLITLCDSSFDTLCPLLPFNDIQTAMDGDQDKTCWWRRRARMNITRNMK